MKNITMYLLSTALFLSFAPTYAEKEVAIHQICKDRYARILHVTKKGKELAFIVEGTTGLHGALIENTPDKPHTYTGIGKSFTKKHSSKITATTDEEVTTINFTLEKNGKKSRYLYQCSPVTLP